MRTMAKKNKNAKYRYLAMALILAMMLGMTGCSKKEAAPEKTDTTEKYGYNVWDYVVLGDYIGVEVEGIKKGEAEDWEIRDNLISDIWSKVQETSTVNGYPQQLYDDYAEYYKTELQQEAEAWGMTADEYIEFFYDEGYTQEDYVVECLKEELLTEAAINATAVSIADDAEYQKLLEQYYEDIGCESAEEAEEQYGKDEITEYLLTQKMYDFLIDKAEITEVGYDEYYGTDTEDGSYFELSSEAL